MDFFEFVDWGYLSSSELRSSLRPHALLIAVNLWHGLEQGISKNHYGGQTRQAHAHCSSAYQVLGDSHTQVSPPSKRRTNELATAVDGSTHKGCPTRLVGIATSPPSALVILHQPYHDWILERDKLITCEHAT
eukprot:2142065-Amphidinium_carterae.1